MLAPFFQQHCLLLGDDPHHLAHIANPDPVVPDQLGLAVGMGQTDLRIAIATHVDVRGFMVIDEDDEAKPGFAVDGHHNPV